LLGQASISVARLPLVRRDRELQNARIDDEVTE